jgi:hypothetical protein
MYQLLAFQGRYQNSWFRSFNDLEGRNQFFHHGELVQEFKNGVETNQSVDSDR